MKRAIHANDDDDEHDEVMSMGDYERQQDDDDEDVDYMMDEDTKKTNGDENDDNDDDYESQRQSVDTRAVETPSAPSAAPFSSASNASSSDPFLDSFYGLSSTDGQTRAQAAKTLLYHCLTGPGANVTDAAYAWKRLIRGLCSGRAGARQGNAAALTAFLKTTLDVMSLDDGGNITLQDIQKETRKKIKASHDDDQNNKKLRMCPDRTFVRQQLIELTEPSQGEVGKRGGRGSEDRDYRFGRLFGIHAIIKSGMLTPWQKSESEIKTYGTLFDSKNGNNSSSDDLVQVSEDLAHDLVGLYRYKKWMREPAAHALQMMLNALSVDSSSTSSVSYPQWEAIVHRVIVPKLLSEADNQPKTKESNNNSTSIQIDFPSLLNFSAEQIALVITVQSSYWYHYHSEHRRLSLPLPSPLDQTLLTVEGIPWIARSIAETSTVTQPRSHLVWDTIWSFLTEEVPPPTSQAKVSAGTSPSTFGTTIQVRRPRSGGLPSCSDNINDILNVLVRHVIRGQLLGMEATVESATETGKRKDSHLEKVGTAHSSLPSANESKNATHERQALALCIVRNLLGIEFVSSNTGRTRLCFESSWLQQLLSDHDLVRRLFLDILAGGIGRGGGGQNKQGPHLLRPLASQILESFIVAGLESLDGDAEISSSITVGEVNQERCWILAKALLECEPRFDGRTRTSTVASLLWLHPNQELPVGALQRNLWKKYSSFLQERSVKAVPRTTSSTMYSNQLVTPYDALGYIDLLFNLGKTVQRRKADDDSEFAGFKAQLTNQIVAFFMAGAFYDCSSVQHVEQSSLLNITKSSKKKRKKQISSSTSFPSEAVEPIIAEAAKIRAIRMKLSPSIILLPYEVRSVMSARFFSMVTDAVTSTLRDAHGDKEFAALELIYGTIKNGKRLEISGGKRLTIGVEDDSTMDTPETILEGLYALTQDQASSDSVVGQLRKRSINSFSLLAYTLYLNLFECGTPDNSDDLDDHDSNDDDEDREETVALLTDTKEVVSIFTSNVSSLEQGQSLRCLTELCLNVLSSPLGMGNQSRGSYATILREAVKVCWISGLTSIAKSAEGSKFEDNVILLLLQGVGMLDEDDTDENNRDSSEWSDDSDGDDDIDEQDESVFVQAAKADDVDMDEDQPQADTSNDVPSEGSGDDDEEIEVDPSKLQSLLEEDSDADAVEQELEHHAGADGALAALLQIKQEARKAGQIARERLQLAKHLRCLLLLDVLLSGRTEGWGSLLSINALLKIMSAIVGRIRELEKSLSKSVGKGGEQGIGEKRTLVERLTSILSTKLLKKKLSTLKWSNTKKPLECAMHYCSLLIKEARQCLSKDQQRLCGSCILFTIRSISDPDEKLMLAQVLSSTVSDWASKRSSGFDSSFFDFLVHQDPVLAQGYLIPELAKSTSNARSSYLKAESLRLLSALYNIKLNNNTSDLEQAVMKRMTKETHAVLQSVMHALNDADLKKSKRFREVVQAIEKVTIFLVTYGKKVTCSTDDLMKLEGEVRHVQSASESHAVKSTTDKIIGLLQQLLITPRDVGESSKSQEDVNENIYQEEKAMNEKEDQPISEPSESKKKKKKKGKNSK